ncbi:hypothetical protein JTB14_016409 [Gonioctena quinquepunctata]|nr:hypothetical protein JTB14_016409 [Gonioctena quinquepunctata]
MASATSPVSDLPNKIEVSTCKYCKKSVTNEVKCVKCKEVFHPSCFKQSCQGNNVICEHITTDDRNQSHKPSNECSLEKENNLLKRIIEEMETIVGHLAGKKGNASSTTKTLSDINCLQTEESGVKTGSADIISLVLVRGNSKGNSQQIKIIDVSRTLLEETTKNKLNNIIHFAENPRQTTPTSTVSEDNTWKTITCRKRKPAEVIVGSNNVNSGNAGAVKGVPKFVDIHVYRVAPDTTKDSMESLLKPNFPEVGCEPLKSRHPQLYASLKVKMYDHHFSEAMNPTLWAENACISRFSYLRRMERQDKTQQQFLIPSCYF